MPKVPEAPVKPAQPPRRSAKAGPPKVEPAPEKIAAPLATMVVPISSLVHDPDNARLHGDKNMETVRKSLRSYGQLKPIVVREQNRVVAAGNGTMRAARELGWQNIAACIVPMTDVEFAGYALIDNRSAELAEWDKEVVSRLSRFLEAEGVPDVGWSAAEIAALRKGEYVEAPTEFPEVGEDIEVEHLCPKCGYAFSGGKTRPKVTANADGTTTVGEDEIPF